MPREGNVEIARRLIEAFNRRDVDSVLADLDPEVELQEWAEAPGSRTYQGYDGVRQALDSWFEAWEWMRVEIEDVIEAGNRLLVTFHQRAKGRGSGVEVELETYNVYTFDDGKVTHMELFTNRDAALDAAGLTANLEEEKR